VATFRHRSTSPAPCGADHARRCGRRLATLLAALALLSTGRPLVLAQAPADTARALQQRAEALRGERRLDDARDVYRILVERDPHDFEYRFWLAKLEGWTGHFATAESLFVELLEERPEDYDSRIALADVRLWAGHYGDAEADLEALQRSHPGDAEVLARLGRLRALRRAAPASHWEMAVEYYGDQLSGTGASNGGSASLEARPNDALRWRAAATVQQKFAHTEGRVGGELAHRLLRFMEIRWSAHVAPGADVLPRQTYGVGLTNKLGAGLVLYADYSFLKFADAAVHRISPRLELYAGPHWVLSGRYAYSSTGFNGVANAVSNHAGSASVGYLYGGSNLLQAFAAVGGEAFALPSRDAIGGFSAHTVGLGWRHFVTPWLGLTLFYAHQTRSDGAKQDSYGLGLMRRW
jgi:YaiO family outer membrane protein